MTVNISSLASGQLSIGDIKAYSEVKMYTAQDVYIRDIPVQDVSWSQSREFGVSVMSLSIINDGTLGKTQVNEIKQDYKIVLIEGYDTGIVNDKFPKFKGFVKDINYLNDSGDQQIKVDVYDELILSQRSDINQTFTANTEYVSGEKLQYIIDNPLSSLYITPINEKIYIIDNGRLDLQTQLTLGTVIIGSNRFTFDPALLIYGSGLSLGIIPVNGTTTGTIINGDVISTLDGDYSVTVTGTTTYSIGGVSYSAYTINKTTIKGRFSHGEVLYKDSSNYFTPINLYECSPKYFNDNTKTPQMLGHVANDVIHTGMISTYRSKYTNWADTKTHGINITRKGFVNTDSDLSSGYEIKKEKGILQLKEPVKVYEYDIIANYYYYPKGLFVEDVIRDVISMDDSLKVNAVTNGIFKSDLYKWTEYNSVGINNIKAVQDGLHIIALENLAVGEYLGVSQDISIVDGFTYTVKVSTKKEGSLTSEIYAELYGYTYTINPLSTGVRVDYTFNFNSTSSGVFPLKLYCKNLSDRDQVRFYDVEVSYIPTRVTTLNKSNLYIKVQDEDGATPNYSLVGNLVPSPIPVYSNLTEYIYSTTNNIYVDTTIFESSGHIMVDSEYIQYTGKTSKCLTGLTRGKYSSTIVDHEIGTRVYQVVDAGRLWSMKYSNIIPQTVNTTSSDYDAVNGVNVGVAGSFTITGGAAFNRFFYRQGIMITNTPATTVTLTSNKNYYFSQLQSTGIETSYILIDYKKIKTRFDAITELRTLLAPNYVISALVRRLGTGPYTYQTFIKGRYLYQKAVEDSSLYNIKSVNYRKQNNSYNRVKLFGKLSNPINIMFNTTTKAIVTDSMADEYIKNVSYKYIGTQYPYEVFQTTDTTGFAAYHEDGGYPYFCKWQALDNFYYDRNWNKIYSSNNSGYLMYTNLGNGTSFSALNLDVKNWFKGYTWFWQSLGGSGSYIQNSIVGVYRTRVTLTSSYADQVFFYNIYHIKYNNANRLKIGDKIGTGTIKRIEAYANNPLYDEFIYVEHDSGTAIYSDGGTNTNGTISFNSYLPSYLGYKGQRNYNSYVGQKWYQIDALLSFYADSSGVETIKLPESGTHKLYINNVLSDTNDRLQENIIELSNRVKTSTEGDCTANFLGVCFSWVYYDTYYRPFNTAGIYINPNQEEYIRRGQGRVDSGNLLEYGTARLEQKAANGSIISSLVLKYFGDENSQNVKDTRSTAPGGDLHTQLKNGGNIFYYRPHSSNFTTAQAAIHNATHLRYHSKYSNVKFYVDADKLFINYTDLKTLNISPSVAEFTVDGPYKTTMLPEDTNTATKPVIERLRDLTTQGKGEQIAIISHSYINQYPLVTIDLGSVMDIGYIDIQSGSLYKPLSIDPLGLPHPMNFSVTVKYFDKDIQLKDVLDTDFQEISDKASDIQMKEGDLQSLSSSDLGENFKARYLKFFVTSNTSPDITEGTATVPIKWFGAAISGLQIYSSDIIVSEKYIDSDVINLYKDSTVYEQLNTQPLLDYYANSKLQEFKKDNTFVDSSIVYSPQLEMGQTVKLNDLETGINQNYFIDSISSSNGGLNLSLAYYE